MELTVDFTIMKSDYRKMMRRAMESGDIFFEEDGLPDNYLTDYIYGKSAVFQECEITILSQEANSVSVLFTGDLEEHLVVSAALSNLNVTSYN